MLTTVSADPSDSVLSMFASRNSATASPLTLSGEPGKALNRHPAPVIR